MGSPSLEVQAIRWLARNGLFFHPNVGKLIERDFIQFPTNKEVFLYQHVIRPALDSNQLEFLEKVLHLQGAPKSLVIDLLDDITFTGNPKALPMVLKVAESNGISVNKEKV
jgi:hypothetical protein